MAFWSTKKKKEQKQEDLLNQGRKDLSTLASMSVSATGDGFIESLIAEAQDKVRVMLREKSGTLPMDVYSRANGLVDIIVGIAYDDYVQENGLSAEQRTALAQVLDTKIPGLIRGYESLDTRVRDESHDKALLAGMVSLQKDMEDIRELINEGSLSASRRFHYMTQQLLAQGERNRTLDVA